jgi:subtilisin family serine protease
MLKPMQAIANFRASNWLAAALICVLMTAFPLTAAAGPPDEMQLEGRQYVRMDEKWYVESTPGLWFEVVPDVVTVRFKETKTKGAMADFFGGRGADIVRANRLGAIDVRVPDGLDPVTFVAELQDTGLFKYAEVNTFGRWEYIPDDTHFGDQWGLDNTGQTGGTVDADVDAPEAWDIGVALPSVAVAVLDSGVEYDHEDLECNIWVNPGEDIGGDGIVMDPADLNGIDDDGNGFIDDLIGWDFAGADNDPTPTNDHGTHVAGIIAACGDNAMGVIGVAGGTGPSTGAKMIPLLIGNAAPDGSILDDAIIYAADNGARVIAMSLSVGYSEAIEDALTDAFETSGVLIVNSSGNDDAAVTFPGIDPHVMAVGATDHNDNRADFSNFGVELEVVAPGVSIRSTTLADTYGWKNGTSMASPHVSGTAALMFSIYPAATNQEVRDCITATAEDQVGDPAEDTAGRDDYYGWGRLNTADAVACIAPNLPPVCDANGPYLAECGLSTALDGTGSYDPDGDAITFLWNGPFESPPAIGPTPSVIFPAPTGLKSVDLTVTDAFGESDACSADVTVQDTLPPDLTAPADVVAECASPEGTPVDLGDPTVSDICDAAVDIVNDAPPLFPVGTTPVLWTATDDSGNQSFDGQDVTVQDTIPPEIFCNAPATITPPDAPVSFTATAEDICDAEPMVGITGYDCFALTKKGKRIDKTDSCVVTFDGATLTIWDSGGVDDHISWTVEASDIHGNTSAASCEVLVVNPAL